LHFDGELDFAPFVPCHRAHALQKRSGQMEVGTSQWLDNDHKNESKREGEGIDTRTNNVSQLRILERK